MNWFGRHKIFPDVGVPVQLRAPRHALARPLGFEINSRVYDGTMNIEVLPFGAPARQMQVRTGMRPSGFTGMLVGGLFPALVDDEDPATLLLIEPTCGNRLPVPQPEFEALWPERNARTQQLRASYPAPSPHELQAVLTATDSPPADPTLAAVRARMRLMTTYEAKAVNDLVRADGAQWEHHQAKFRIVTPLDFDGSTDFADVISHLRHVDGHQEIDPHPLMTIGQAVRWRHLAAGASAVTDDFGEQPTADDLRSILAPFVQVCGPITGSS